MFAGAEPRLAISATCAVPAAIPNDGRDDRVAIQNALDSQGCAHLSAGKYDIDSIKFTPPARRPYMMLELAGTQLFGDGPGTVLAFRGSTGSQDWEGIRMTGAGPVLHDLAIATTGISDMTEQTHAVELLGPATDADIARVSFNHPIRAGKSGDCVQLIAYNDGREIDGVKIHDNDFLHCDRSGVAVHSGTTHIDIVNNRFDDVGNTDLDFEGTGDTGDLLIAHNTFTMSLGPHGVGAIQLQQIDGARVTENVLDGRGIGLYQSDDVEIDDNQITLRQTTTEPTIAVAKDSSHARIVGNSIVRTASAGAGAVISAGPHGSGTPDHLEIDGNALVQRTSSHVVNSGGVVGLYVRHNAISYSGPLANVMWGVLALGSAGTNGVRTTDVRVEGNTFTGPLRGAVATSGSYFGVGTLDTSGNISTGPTYGIYCDNFASQGGVAGPITSTEDDWPAPSCGPANFVSVLAPGRAAPPAPDAGAGAGAGASASPGPDTTAPLLSGVSLTRAAFRVAKAPRGTVLRFSSSEAGTLSIKIERLRPGQKARRVATLTRAIAAGPGSLALSGRVGARAMTPGGYRLTLTARDAAGNLSRSAARAFTILAG